MKKSGKEIHIEMQKILKIKLTMKAMKYYWAFYLRLLKESCRIYSGRSFRQITAVRVTLATKQKAEGQENWKDILAEFAVMAKQMSYVKKDLLKNFRGNGKLISHTLCPDWREKI